jgi:hypothetical protein
MISLDVFFSIIERFLLHKLSTEKISYLELISYINKESLPKVKKLEEVLDLSLINKLVAIELSDFKGNLPVLKEFLGINGINDMATVVYWFITSNLNYLKLYEAFVKEYSVLFSKAQVLSLPQYFYDVLDFTYFLHIMNTLADIARVCVDMVEIEDEKAKVSNDLSKLDYTNAIIKYLASGENKEKSLSFIIFNTVIVVSAISDAFSSIATNPDKFLKYHSNYYLDTNMKLQLETYNQLSVVNFDMLIRFTANLLKYSMISPIIGAILGVKIYERARKEGR